MEDWKRRLKSAREAAGLNKTKFAIAVGVSNPTVTDWEKSTHDGGIIEITGPRLTKICEVLNISPRWLLYGEAGTPAPQLQIVAIPVPDERPARLILAHDDEEALLDLYRRTDDRGRIEIAAASADEVEAAIKRSRSNKL